MLAAISILVVALGFIYQSNKKYTWVMLIWMWVLFAFNTLNGDYLAYEKIYNRIAANDVRMISTYEEAFVLLCQMGSRVFNWDYQQFIVFIATLSIILFAVVIRLYCWGSRQNFVLSLFMIFLYWMFICQYRTYIAILFTLIGMFFLEKIEGWRGTVLFLLFLLLAVTFHRMAGLYIIILAARFFGRRVLVFFAPVFMVAVLLVRNPAFSTFLSRYIVGYKMDRWLYSDGSRSLIGIMILVFVRVGIAVIENHCYKINFRSGAKSAYLESQEFIIKVTIICLTLLPLEMFMKDYERLARLPLFLSFVFFAKYIDGANIDRHHLPLSVALYGGYFGLYMFSFYTSFYGWFLHNLIPILSNNTFISF